MQSEKRLILEASSFQHGKKEKKIEQEESLEKWSVQSPNAISIYKPKSIHITACDFEWWKSRILFKEKNTKKKKKTAVQHLETLIVAFAQWMCHAHLPWVKLSSPLKKNPLQLIRSDFL